MASMSFTIRDAAGMAGVLVSVQNLVARALKGGPVIITLGRETRTEAQNRKLWPMLTDVAGQVQWFDEWLQPSDWKHIFTAAVKKHRTVPGIDGGIVVLGLSTSSMKKKEFSDLIEFMYSWGSEKGVNWSEKSTDIYEQHRDTA